MVKFKIEPVNGKTIPHYRKSRHAFVVYWTVYFFSVMRGYWIFLKSFYTEERALNYVAEVKAQISRGDFSCLTLKP